MSSDLEDAMRASCANPKARTPVVEERPRILGGADIAALLGLSKYANAVDVYARLVHGVKRVVTRSKRGLDAEKPLRDSYVEHIGPLLDESPGLVVCPEMPWLGGHPDALTVAEVVDWKTLSRWAAPWGVPGTDEAPADVVCQLNWYCWLTGRNRWHAYLGTGEDLPDGGFSYFETSLYLGEFDEELHETAMRAAMDFRERHWLPQVWPEGEPIGKGTIREVRRCRAVDAVRASEVAHGR